MYNSSFRACLFVIVLMLLLLSPLGVHAAGLGKLTLNSALGQPLQAEIDIVTVNDDELSSLNVELASRDAFTQAGIRYESFFSTFNVSVESRTNGDPYVVITSPQSVNEPFLNILVELSWASGRLLREYTVLLDPVEFGAPEPVAPTVTSTPDVVETQVDTPEQTPQAADQASDPKEPVAEPEAVPISQISDRGDTYGPVVRGDNLSDIARKIIPDGVNLNQMLVAMYRANREAFIDNNMNLLRVGAMLRIPDGIELTAIDAAEANAEVKIQVTNWRNYRKKLVEAAAESQPSEAEVLSQADSGQISTTVDNEVTVPGEEPKEVLRLSSGVQIDAQGEEGADTTMLDRLRMTEEDAIAHSLALEEANERVAMLEKQVEDLQQLLELKQPGFAQAQVQAEAVLDIDVKPEAEAETEAAVSPEAAAIDEAVEMITPAPESITDEGFTPEQEVTEFSPFMEEPILEPVEEPFQETVQEPVVSPEPLPVEEEVSYLDLVLQNVEYIVGALLVLLGALFIIKRRQNKSKDELDADEMDFDEISPSMRDKMAAVAAAGTAASVDSDNLSSEYDSANEPQAEETQEDDFDREESFFQEEKNDDEQVAHMDLATEPLQETEDASADDEFVPDHEIELDLDDASPLQEDSVEAEAIEEGGEQVETKDEVDLDFSAEATTEEDSAAQPEEDHEIEFDLGDLSDDESKSEQEETDAELTETQIDLIAETEPLIEPEELSEPLEPAEPLEPSEPALAASETDEDASSDDQIDLMATTLAESPEDLKDVAEALDYDADTGSDEATPEIAASVSEEAADPNSIDFEQQDVPVIESSDRDDSTNETEDAASDEAVVDANVPPSELDLADINLEMEDEQVTDADKSVEADTELPEIVEDVPEVPEASEVTDASDTSELSDAPEESDMPESTEKSEQWQEVETKMDLAKAYQEMDDKEGAREMFEEVIRDGDKEQQEKAKALLDEL